MRYAVFPGGARVRARLCLAVARACEEDKPTLAAGVAASIELIHCASLVHDDLPCFDDAATRRGRPSVHRAFGEKIAVLAGDALIVLAVQSLVHAAERAPSRLGPLLLILSRAVGAPNGIIAGQAWECEPQVELAKYQQAKTGALFAAATAAGACAAGRNTGNWYLLGERIGEAYQIADDLRDVFSTECGCADGHDGCRVETGGSGAYSDCRDTGVCRRPRLACAYPGGSESAPAATNGQTCGVTSSCAMD
jgi:geranylgeranyl diphosphate synthase type II